MEYFSVFAAAFKSNTIISKISPYHGHINTDGLNRNQIWPNFMFHNT